MNAHELQQLPIEQLDKMAFGVTQGEQRLPLKNIKIKYQDDYDNALEYVTEHPDDYGEALDTEPVDVALERGVYWLEDGHHRYVTAQLRGDADILADLTIKDNPVHALMEREAMFIYKGHLYTALSPADKRKKRDLAFDRELEEAREEREWEWESFSEVVDVVVEQAVDAASEDEESKLVDLQNIHENERHLLGVLDKLHGMFADEYSDRQISQIALNDYLSDDLLEAFHEAQRAVLEAKQQGASPEEIATLVKAAEDVQAEIEEEISAEDQGDTFIEAREDLEQRFEEDHWDDAVAAYIKENDLKTADSLEKFLWDRARQLVQMEGKDVWRAQVVGRNSNLRRPYSLGRYWTDQKELARPFSNEMGQDSNKWRDPIVVRYHARVDNVKDIDLYESLDANAWAYLELLDKYGNRTDLTEVRFYPKAPIYVYDVDVLDMDAHDPGFDYDAEVLETIPINGMRRA